MSPQFITLLALAVYLAAVVVIIVRTSGRK
jgi:hypothetical protein